MTLKRGIAHVGNCAKKVSLFCKNGFVSLNPFDRFEWKFRVARLNTFFFYLLFGGK